MGVMWNDALCEMKSYDELMFCFIWNVMFLKEFMTWWFDELMFTKSIGEMMFVKDIFEKNLLKPYWVCKFMFSKFHLLRSKH